MLGGLIGSAIGAIGGFLGQQSANESNRRIAASNSAFNAQQAQLNREFQERMSNTAYVRAVQDLKNAGLNPMLAYSQGGASSPSGSTAEAVQPAPMQNKFAAATQAAQSLASLDLAKSQADKTKAETRNVEVDTQRRELELPPSREYVVDRMYTEYAKLRHEVGIAKWDEYIVEKWLRNVGPERERIKAEARSTKALAVIRELERVEKKAQADYFHDVGKGGIYWREGRAAAGAVLGVGTAAAARRALGQGLRPRSYLQRSGPGKSGTRWTSREYSYE